MANCDEFIFYDDLVREVKRAAAKRDERKSQPSPTAKRAPDEGNRRKEELEARKSQAIEMVVEMFDALVSERGDSGKIWASLLKDTLKRRRPDFNETYFGFRTFGNLLEEAQARGLLEFGRDEKSGAYVYRSDRAASAVNAPAEQAASAPLTIAHDAIAQEPEAAPEMAEMVEEAVARPEPRRRGRGGRTDFRAPVVAHPEAEVQAEPGEAELVEAPAAEAPQWTDESPFPPPAEEKRRSPRGGRKSTAKKAEAAVEAAPAAAEPVAVAPEPVEQAEDAPARKAARKPAARSRRPAKPKATPEIA